MLWSLVACVDVGEMRVDEIVLDDLVLGRMFVVRLDEADPASITCTTPSDPAEVHVLESPAGTEHGFTVLGLLAGTDYDWTIRAGEGRRERSEVHSISTDPLPGWLPEWTTELVPDPDRGYTLLNHGLDTTQPDREAKLLIVDPDGRLRWYYESPWDASDLDAQ